MHSYCVSRTASIEPLAVELIERSIYLIRGHKVMLDSDLADLYGVPTKQMNQQVRRNLKRFPEDFMFRLVDEEAEFLRSQFGTSKTEARGGLLRSQSVTLKRGQHRKYAPYVFTEQGVATLSSVLHSERAIQVNIAIMRAFVKLREILASHKDLAAKVDALEQKYDARFRMVFDAIRKLMQPPPAAKRPRIGFAPEGPKGARV